MKTILVNAYTALNLGDDLFLKILFEKFPDSKFLLLAQKKQYKTWEQKYRNVSIINFYFTIVDRLVLRIVSYFRADEYLEKYILEKYRIIKYLEGQADAYLYIGGSIFQQNSIGGISILDKVNKLITNIFINKPKFILGANFGPFIENEYVDYYTEIFSKYNDVCFRDIFSYNLFRNISSVRCEKDIIFCLDNIANIEKEKNSVGFSLIGLHNLPTMHQYKDLYMAKIIQIVKKLVLEDKKVYFFSFCKYAGDEKMLKQILDKLPKEIKITIVKYRGDIDTFLSSYSRMEAIFATRFHAMIISLMVNQYVYPLIYSDKMSNVLQDLGCNIKYSHIRNLDTPENMINDLYANKVYLPLSNIRDSAENQLKKLAQFIKEDGIW